MHWLLDRDLMIVLLISIVAAATGFAALTAVLLHHLLSWKQSRWHHLYAAEHWRRDHKAETNVTLARVHLFFLSVPETLMIRSGPTRLLVPLPTLSRRHTPRSA